jgi:preprotein translocase subunit SecE
VPTGARPRGDTVTATRTETASPRPAGGGGPGGRIGRYVREIISEMRKVLWPSRSELITYSIVVIIFVVIMIAIVAGLDIGLAKLVLKVFA